MSFLIKSMMFCASTFSNKSLIGAKLAVAGTTYHWHIWLHGRVLEHRPLTGELSLPCTWPTADR